MWGVDEYSRNSPGAQLVDFFCRIARPKPGASILDVGAGAGAGSRALRDLGFSVRAFDITAEAWRHEDIHLDTGCIWRDLTKTFAYFDFAYCTDVMEHIPTEFTALAISEILKTVHDDGRAFFSISFGPDNCGQFIGEPLHLTVKPFTWWCNLIREVGTLHDARDLIGDGVFLVGR